MKRHPMLTKPKPTNASKLDKLNYYIQRCKCKSYKKWLKQQKEILLEKKL